MASYVGIGADDPNHPLEVEGQVFVSNVEQGSATNLVPFEVYSDYTGITGDILEGARQLRLRVTPSATTTSNVNMDMGIEPTGGSYFYISNPVQDATLGSNTAFRIVQAGHVEIGSNLSVSGNVVASNIIGGSPLTLSSDTLVTVDGSGGLYVTGPLNVDGTVTSASLTVSGDATFTTGTISDYIVHAGDTDTYFGFVNDDDIVFNTNGSERMRIENTGNVGIGNDSPQQRLEVWGNILVGENNINSFIHGGSSIAVSSDDNVLIVADANDPSGTAVGDIIFGYGSAINTDSIRDFTYAQAFPSGLPRVELMRIDSSANRVGILKSTPGTTLDVNGTIRGTSISSTGVINGASATVTGDVQGASASLGAIDGSSLSVSGAVRGATVSSSGAVQGSSASLGGITGSSLSVSGDVRTNGSFRVDANNGITKRSGTYGSVKTFGNGNSSYDGYSINGDAIFMSNGSSYGLYFESGSGNQWGIRFDYNGTTELKHANATKLSTTSGGVNVTGTVSASGHATFTTGTISDYIVHKDDTNTYMGFNANDQIVMRTAGTDRVTVKSDGDVGINTTNPGTKLDVNGSARVGTFTVTSSQTMPDIGSNSAKLNFVLGVYAFGTDTWSNYADNYTSGFVSFSRLTWDVNGNDKMRLDGAGDLDIDGTYGTFSDYRIKENIQSIDDDYAMGVIRGLDPKTFNWKDKQKDKGTEYGFIAQEVKALYPEMVSTKPDTIPMDQTSYPAQITSDTTMEITVSDGSTWTSGDKIAVNDNTNHRHTLTIHEIQNSVLSLTAETISSNMVDSNSETYIYGKEVDDFHRMKVSYLDPLMISAIQQLDRRLTALENR